MEVCDSHRSLSYTELAKYWVVALVEAIVVTKATSAIPYALFIAMEMLLGELMLHHLFLKDFSDTPWCDAAFPSPSLFPSTPSWCTATLPFPSSLPRPPGSGPHFSSFALSPAHPYPLQLLV